LLVLFLFFLLFLIWLLFSRFLSDLSPFPYFFNFSTSLFSLPISCLLEVLDLSFLYFTLLTFCTGNCSSFHWIYWCREFEANVIILHHSTTICCGYQPVVHCGVLRQSAEMIEIKGRENLKTGESKTLHWYCTQAYVHTTHIHLRINKQTQTHMFTYTRTYVWHIYVHSYIHTHRRTSASDNYGSRIKWSLFRMRPHPKKAIILFCCRNTSITSNTWKEVRLMCLLTSNT
jgi:Elongation factor Tu C-terminal domain